MNESAPPDAPATQPESSPWSTADKIKRVLWMYLGKTLFRASFHNMYAYRRLVLRLFGADIAPGARVRPTAHIEIPWHLKLGRDCVIGDHAILYSLGVITVGERTIVSQYAHLCAGTHDFTDAAFPLVREPITLGDDAWIAADAFVGPGVTVGDRAVLGARSCAYRDIPAGKVCVGNPAKVLKDRVIT